MLENKKSLFKPLNKDFIKIKCCEFCRTFCRTTKFFIIKTSSTFLRNTWGSNGADGQVIVFSMLLQDFLHILFYYIFYIFYNILSFKFIQDILKITCIALLIAL